MVKEVKEGQRENSGIISCQICGKANYNAISCWTIYDYSYIPKWKIPLALVAMTLNERHHDANLYADSGATSHKPNSPGKLKNLNNYMVMEKVGKFLTLVAIT